MEAFMSKNLSTVIESCVERVKEGLERALTKAMEWTLHQTEEDAVSELGRAELVFLMAVSALAHLDTEVSGMLLKEVERWSVFPRIKKYMSGKMDAEWQVPREMIDRASKFAHVLEVGGLFFVPPELRAYLAELLAEDYGCHAGAENNSQESKRPRKDPRGPQQVEESSADGQAPDGESQQERRYRLVAKRRRSHKQKSRGQEKGKHVPSHQQVLAPTLHNIDRSTPEPTPGPSTIQTSSYPLHTHKPTGTIPKVPQQAKSSAAIPVPNPATGAIPKVRKEARRRSPVERMVAVPSPRARQVTSAGCQTEEPPTPAAVEVTSAASQTPSLPRVNKEEAQRWILKGVKEDNGELIEGAVLGGANIEEKVEGRWTALTLAARDGRLGAVRALVRLGAQLEGRDGDWGKTALHWASSEGHEAVVRWLLAAGASVRVENKLRSTPLHGASVEGHLHIAKLLVEAGANMNHRNRDGDTPLARAEDNRHYAVAEYLRSVGARK